MSKAKEVNDSNFETEVLKSDKPVLVDFWAPWCGPCKAIAPAIDELAAEYGGQIKITKCNVDENSATPGKYGIKAIPTLLFFKGGDLVDQLRGLVAKDKIDESLKKLL